MTVPKKTLFAVFAVAVSSLITLFVLELAVRWAIPAFDPSGHVEFQGAGSPRPYLGRPGSTQRQIKNTGDFDVTIRFNGLGFRDDRELKDFSASDWIAVGDSLSFGWGVEERGRVTERLEEQLAIRIFNLSVPGDLNVTAEILEFARAQGAKIRKVMVFFSMEARLIDYEARRTPARQAPASGFSLANLKNHLMTHSALYFLLTSVVHRSPPLKAFFVKVGLINPNNLGFPRRKLDPVVIRSTTRRIASLVEGYEAVVIVCPSRGLWATDTRADERRVHSAFLESLRQAGIRFIDAAPAFEVGGSPEDYFFKNDGHWSPRGHAALATYLSNSPVLAATLRPEN